MMPSLVRLAALALLGTLLVSGSVRADDLPAIEVEGQPLAANVERLLQALDVLGTPLPDAAAQALAAAIRDRDPRKLQELLDPHVLIAVNINPESRVKAARGPAKAVLQQAGFTPLLVKVVNEAGVTAPLRVHSPQAGPVYAGTARLSMTRQGQLHLLDNQNVANDKGRFLHLEVFAGQPMTAKLSGLGVEYVIALAYSSEAGKREANLGFDVGQGTQDLGFRAEVPVLFTVKPAVPVTLTVKDHDGSPTTGRFVFRDEAGHVYPAQTRRLAPDLFFQRQIYRHDGESVLLPPGQLTLFASRGPEYRQIRKQVTIPASGEAQIEVRLERWIDPAAAGFFSGDHHVHASGCAHFTSPSEGIPPRTCCVRCGARG